MLKSIEDSFYGCIIGGAIGDALGNPIEGYSSEDIRKKYGDLKDYVANWDLPGTYTDDTELTVLLISSLTEVGAFSVDDLSRRFVRWLPKANSFGLATQEACINLSRGRYPSESGIDSAGNGAAMRIAPLGLLYSHPNDLSLLKKTTVKSSKITHTDPKSIAGALAISGSIAYLVQNKDGFKKNDYTRFITRLVSKYSSDLEKKLIYISENLNRLNPSYIGTSAYVLESVPFAIYCFLKSPNNFENSVLLALNSGGDTDTNTSMTASLSGCLNGYSKIPQKWIESLRGREELEKLIENLWNLYLFNLPDSRELQIYVTELEYRKVRDDPELKATLAGKLGALYSLNGNNSQERLILHEGLNCRDISEGTRTKLCLLLAKSYYESGEDGLALSILNSIQSKDIFLKIAVEVMKRDKSLKALSI